LSDRRTADPLGIGRAYSLSALVDERCGAAVFVRTEGTGVQAAPAASRNPPDM
jgi:hypothetical protein